MSKMCTWQQTTFANYWNRILPLKTRARSKSDVRQACQLSDGRCVISYSLVIACKVIYIRKVSALGSRVGWPPAGNNERTICIRLAVKTSIFPAFGYLNLVLILVLSVYIPHGQPTRRSVAEKSRLIDRTLADCLSNSCCFSRCQHSWCNWTSERVATLAFEF